MKAIEFGPSNPCSLLKGVMLGFQLPRWKVERDVGWGVQATCTFFEKQGVKLELAARKTNIKLTNDPN